MQYAFIWLAAGLIALTCAVHSIVGEARLIGPIMRQRDGVLASDLARQVLRFAWHFTSALGLVLVWFLVRMADGSIAVDQTSLIVVGVTFALSALVDAIYTRGKHIGWPLILASGAAALASLL